jgi:hypothetical protein
VALVAVVPGSKEMPKRWPAPVNDLSLKNSLQEGGGLAMSKLAWL